MNRVISTDSLETGLIANANANAWKVWGSDRAGRRPDACNSCSVSNRPKPRNLAGSYVKTFPFALGRPGKRCVPCGQIVLTQLNTRPQHNLRVPTGLSPPHPLVVGPLALRYGLITAKLPIRSTPSPPNPLGDHDPILTPGCNSSGGPPAQATAYPATKLRVQVESNLPPCFRRAAENRATRRSTTGR